MASPLLNVHCITEPSCKYPVALRVTMDDGTVQTYNLESKTEFSFNRFMQETQESLDRLFACFTVGYKYKPPERKKYRNR